MYNFNKKMELKPTMVWAVVACLSLAEAYDFPKEVNVRTVDTPNSCYEVTWVSDQQNLIRNCPDSDEYPCNPLKYKETPLPPSDQELAEWADPESDEFINATCTKGVAEACIKYTYYTRNEAQSEFNITRFCGKGVKLPDGTEVDSGCYDQELEGYILETCFCQDQICNAGSILQVHLLLLAVTALALLSNFALGR